jgi:ribosomal protein RSM22 (predicted rRNA methylase)
MTMSLAMNSPLITIERHLASLLLSAKGWSQYQQGDVSKVELQPFVQAVRTLSERYTQHSVGAYNLPLITSDIDAAAYALYYLPINAAKVVHLAPLLELSRSRLRVADFGCGPGTVALALLASSATLFDFLFIEKSQPMQALAQKVVSTWSANNARGVVRIASHIPSDEAATYDIVFAANSIAELHDDLMHDTIQRLLSLLAPNGILVLLEPGQQLHTRRLMTLRDRLLEQHPTLSALFPCTHNNPCPMLRSSATDWCHGALEWIQPPLNAQLDDALAFNKHRIKYSALVMRLGATPQAGYRVLAPSTKGAQGIETLVCGGDFYGLTRIRKGSRTDGNRPLEKASVFDRVIVTEGALPNASQATLRNEGPH